MSGIKVLNLILRSETEIQKSATYQRCQHESWNRKRRMLHITTNEEWHRQKYGGELSLKIV